ncbi:MAG: HAMP domain-containing histidine kinase [Acidobacteria bacterium]|nr:HAMP domain-containing histidine kinase [Acidobacteriota bacterium]
MKIATKIAAGYGVVIVLLLAVLSYQVFLISQMQSVNQSLSRINFRASIVSLQLLRDLDQVEEFTRKFFVTADPGYSSQIEEVRNALSQELQEILSLPLSSKEKEEIDQFSGLWDEFLRTTSDLKVSPEDIEPWEAELNRRLALLSDLRLQAQSVIPATRQAIELRVEQSAQASESAQRLSWIAALATLLLSLGVSFWIVRSISTALRALTEGAQAVGEGKFFYQMDASGNDELAHFARDFNTMTRRLGELDQLKKDFISHISHELKSPLASIREAIRLLLEGIPGPLAEQQRRLLELSLESGARLSSMIGNLLDLSQIEAGVMEYDIQKRDLCAIVRTALAEFEVQARRHGVRMEAQLPQEPLPVGCDGDRILQVISNITGNALKFSPKGSAIQVRLRPLAEVPFNVPATWRQNFAPTHDRFALLSIADTGPGIPDSEKEKIFEKFHQVKQATAQQSRRHGVGLGLAITRNIVEAHHGAIWAEDNPGGGSVFYILLAGESVRVEAPSPISSPL